MEFLGLGVAIICVVIIVLGVIYLWNLPNDSNRKG